MVNDLLFIIIDVECNTLNANAPTNMCIISTSDLFHHTSKTVRIHYLPYPTPLTVQILTIGSSFTKDNIGDSFVWIVLKKKKVIINTYTARVYVSRTQ